MPVGTIEAVREVVELVEPQAVGEGTARDVTVRVCRRGTGRMADPDKLRADPAESPDERGEVHRRGGAIRIDV